MAAFATPAELSDHTKGLIPADDPRAQPILDGATEALRNYARWHIAPAQNVTTILDGGSAELYLPTLKLNSVTSITMPDGSPADLNDFEWSRQTGNLRRKDGGIFPERWGGYTVTFNSGYAETPAALKQIVLQVSAIALSSPTGATREQAGAVAMSWATTAPGVSGGLSLLARDYAALAPYVLPKVA